MRLRLIGSIVVGLCLGILPAWAAEPQLTIYNQNFAVVRVLIPLNLTAGENHIQFTDTTAYLEPDSVILRDPTGARVLQILEQNYRADPVSQQRLLSLYEGKTLEFLVQRGDHTETVQGKIIRSGYVPPWPNNPYGNPYPGNQPGMQQPIIEVDGKLRFQLPGTPLFPTLTDDTILKPTLNWVLMTDKPGEVNAEFSYVTGQMNWNADYNLVAPEEGDHLDMVGWVTIHNQTGKTFDSARIKLMAGEVNKIQPAERLHWLYQRSGRSEESLAACRPRFPKKPLKNTTSTNCIAPPRFTTRKASRLNSCALPESNPSGCMFTTG